MLENPQILFGLKHLLLIISNDCRIILSHRLSLYAIQLEGIFLCHMTAQATHEAYQCDGVKSYEYGLEVNDYNLIIGWELCYSIPFLTKSLL